MSILVEKSVFVEAIFLSFVIKHDILKTQMI